MVVDADPVGPVVLRGGVPFGVVARRQTLNVGQRRRSRLGKAVFLVAGLAFKLGVVPFHMWIPDVYQGAPSPVSAFMSSAVKVAAFGGMVRVFVVAYDSYRDQWAPIVFVLAVLAWRRQWAWLAPTLRQDLTKPIADQTFALDQPLKDVAIHFRNQR